MTVRTARRHRKNPTDAETRLGSRLRRKQLDGHRFRRQAPLGPYVADFICFEARLESHGHRVLRFWNNDVLGNTDGVIEAIRSALAYPPPQPSPARGEGEKRKR